MSSGNDKSAGETSHDEEEEEEEDVNEIFGDWNRDNDDDVFSIISEDEQEGRRMAIYWVGCGYGEEILLGIGSGSQHSICE